MSSDNTFLFRFYIFSIRILSPFKSSVLLIVFLFLVWEIDYVTFASPSNSQRGWKKNCRPFAAPSRVRDRMRKTTIRRNGSVAVRYLTCADDLMDFQMEKYTMIHAVIKHATSSHLKIPGSSMPLLICRTLLLNRKAIIFFFFFCCRHSKLRHAIVLRLSYTRCYIF